LLAREYGRAISLVNASTLSPIKMAESNWPRTFACCRQTRRKFSITDAFKEKRKAGVVGGRHEIEG
jgi:hypothetical protein